MKKTALIEASLMAAAFIALGYFAPDRLSLFVLLIMAAIIVLAFLYGIIPALMYADGFRRGIRGINNALEGRNGTVYTAISSTESFFRQNTLDTLFEEYKDKTDRQRSSKQIVTDIEEYINEDVLSRRSWQSLVAQVPGTLTGLGLLGTFLGLVIGINFISISSIDATIDSIQNLLGSVGTAFYTSISGVILSIMFNIICKFTWSLNMREMGQFTELFHKYAVPTSGEQILYRENRQMERILAKLDRLPKLGEYSVSNGGTRGDEQILMPQILDGLNNNEFIFYLQPRFDLNSMEIIGADALVRWNHAKLGLVAPSVFIPVLEENGCITKLDQYIWEHVCEMLRNWIDSGRRVLPISVNVTKTDILAMDVVDIFDDLVRRYKIPPRYLEIEIARNTYLETAGSAVKVSEELRAMGFRVVMDGFDGNYLALQPIGTIHTDALKLDLRNMNDESSLAVIFEQSRKLHYNLIVEGIESMDQMSRLRKCGCTEGVGYYLSKPMAAKKLEEMLDQGR